jgi:alpha-glucosidase
VAWDWWNDRGLRDVDFKPGINTKTYERYIDFAAQNGLEYVILDEGWYKITGNRGDLLSVVPELDMNALAAYARQKKVGLIMWVIWKTFDDQLEPALAEFERWGVKGVKVDFMQRDDQPVMRFYTRICRATAKHRMLVDFHGGIRATLLARTFPNLVSTEGVRGLEHVKWSVAPDPEHDVTLPFTRMYLGPMDFTPGAMTNADRAHFAINFKQPMSLGTRCHQLAMYVVYESPLQMLADSPSAYAREPEIMEFLGPVPSTWDETRVLDGRIGDYVIVARRKGADWWIGAMTDWSPRALTVDLSFLPEGRFGLTSYEDAADADHAASHYRKTATASVGREVKLSIKLAPGGGWVGRISAAPARSPARSAAP